MSDDAHAGPLQQREREREHGQRRGQGSISSARRASSARRRGYGCARVGRRRADRRADFVVLCPINSALAAHAGPPSRPDTVPGFMRRLDLVLAAPVLLGPAALAFAKGGYFDVPRLVAGVVACALVVVVAVRDRAAGPARARWLARGRPGGADGVDRAVDRVGAGRRRRLRRLPAPAALPVRVRRRARGPAAARRCGGWSSPSLLAGIVAAALYGLSERLLPGVFSLQPLPSADDRLAWPLTYWNAMGALTGMGLVLAAVAAVAGRGRDRPGPRPRLLPDVLARRARRDRRGPRRPARARADASSRRAACVVAGGAAVLAALATIPLSAVEAPGGSAAQGAAMLAVLALLAAAAAWPRARPRRRRPPRRRRSAAAAAARPRAPRLAARRRRLAPATPPLPASVRLRAAALGALALALVVTAIAVTRVERTGSGPAQGANPVAARLGAVQPLRVLAGGGATSSPTLRCGAAGRGRSGRTGCASGRSTRRCATRTRCTSRPPPSSGWSACVALLAVRGRDRRDGARGRAGAAGAIGALAVLRDPRRAGLGLGAAGADARRVDARREARSSGRSTRRQLSVASSTEPASANDRPQHVRVDARSHAIRPQRESSASTSRW